MQRIATTLTALAFLWACAATAFLLLAWSEAGLSTSAILGTAAEGARMPSLATANGVWMAGLLLVVTVLAGIPLGIALAHPAGQRAAAWATGLLLLGFCLIAGSSVGLHYLPTTLLLMVAGAVATLAPPAAP